MPDSPIWRVLLVIGLVLAAIPVIALFTYVVTRAFYAARTGSWRRAVRDTITDLRADKEGDT